MARSNLTLEERFDLFKQNAESRGKEFTLTLENVRKLTAETHCQYTGVAFDSEAKINPSLERVDNNLGYVPGNVVPVTVIANQIKSDFPLQTLKKRSINYGKRRVGAFNMNTDKVAAARRKIKSYEDQIARINEVRLRAEETLARQLDELERSRINMEEDQAVADVSGQIYEAIVSNPYMGWKYLTPRQKLKFMVTNFSPKQLFAKLKVKIKH